MTMDSLRFKSVILLFTLVVALSGCGLLSDTPNADPAPISDNPFGALNTITLSINGETVIFPGNFTRHNYYEETADVPGHSILFFGSASLGSTIDFKIYDESKFLRKRSYMGVSSYESLDGLVFINIGHKGKNYSSLVFGEGPGGTTIYHDSFFTVNELSIARPAQNMIGNRILDVKGSFSGTLMGQDSNENIIVNGTYNLKE
jgi:hypothetical protein